MVESVIFCFSSRFRVIQIIYILFTSGHYFYGFRYVPWCNYTPNSILFKAQNSILRPFVSQKSLQWFRKGLDEERLRTTELYTRCLLEVKHKMEEGRAKECLSSNALKTARSEGMSFTEMSYAVSSSFSAGISTVRSEFHFLPFKNDSKCLYLLHLLIAV